MGQTTKASAYAALPAVDHVDDDRWSVPRTAMLVTVASAGLWSLILLGIRWLLG